MWARKGRATRLSHWSAQRIQQSVVVPVGAGEERQVYRVAAHATMGSMTLCVWADQRLSRVTFTHSAFQQSGVDCLMLFSPPPTPFCVCAPESTSTANEHMFDLTESSLSIQ